MQADTASAKCKPQVIDLLGIFWFLAVCFWYHPSSSPSSWKR